MSRKVGPASSAGRECAEPDAQRPEVVGFLKRYESAFRATARRCSFTDEDAEDALQRSIEILLTRAPRMDRRAGAAWMHVVVRHEALRIRRLRHRVVAGGDPNFLPEADGVKLLEGQRPESLDPAELYERQDEYDRFRQAFRRLKASERRALCLIGEGYSYAEIEDQTGWSYTKINRLLSEGRMKMREMLGELERGQRCGELGESLSRFCDGEIGDEEEAELRDHLAACKACQATLRSYRLTSGTAAMIFPLVPATGKLGGYLQETLAWLQSRLPGRGSLAEAALSLPAGGGGGGGQGSFAALAKLAVVCAGIGGGTGACVATGVLPVPNLPVASLVGDREAGRTAEERPSAQSTPAEETAPPPATYSDDDDADLATTSGPGDAPAQATSDRPDPRQSIAGRSPAQAEFGVDASGSEIKLPGAGHAGSPVATASAAPVDHGSTGATPPPSTSGSGSAASPPGASADRQAIQPGRPPLAAGPEFAP